MAWFRALSAQRLSGSSGSNTDEMHLQCAWMYWTLKKRQAARVGADKGQGDPLFGENRSQTEVRAEEISE